MLPEIIRVNKSMQRRLEEYYYILNESDTSCADIHDVWSSVFDIALTYCGWQALWMMSEANCKKYSIMHPSVVVVSVQAYTMKDLTGCVRVVAVQEDILLPCVLDVPLVELHPIKEQVVNDRCDLEIVADWLDRCRYFFKYLWYPWDCKGAISLSEWCSSHLKNRLQLQYDMNNQVLDPRMTKYVQSLIKEAQEVDEEVNALSTEDLEDHEKLILINNHLRRKRLKVELEMFEEPDLRNTMVLWTKQRVSSAQPLTAYIVWTQGSFDSIQKFMDACRTPLPQDCAVRVSSSLMQALEECNAGDKVLLSPGDHVIKALESLESGGTLQGVGRCEETTLTAEYCCRKAVLLETFGPVVLENLTIEREEGVILQMYISNLTLRNCRLAANSSPTSRGIVVLQGCHLVMESCHLVDLGTGIYLQKGATAYLKDCVITCCYEGIKLTDESQLTTTRVEISSSRRHGVRLETSVNDEDTTDVMVGGADLLNTALICMTDTTLKNNAKGDVIVKKVSCGFVIDPEVNDADMTEAEDDLDYDSRSASVVSPGGGRMGEEARSPSSGDSLRP